MTSPVDYREKNLQIGDYSIKNPNQTNDAGNKTTTIAQRIFCCGSSSFPRPQVH